MRQARAIRIRALAVATVLIAVPVAACGGEPATKASVCGAYDELGQQMVKPHPFSDSVIFRKTRELADQASRYEQSAPVRAHADRLREIGEGDSTSSTDLGNATTAIAGLCGHPLGIASTTDQSTDTPPAPPPPSDEGGLYDALTDGDGATAATAAIDKRVERQSAVTRRRPQDPDAWSELARLRFQRAGIDGIAADGTYTDEGKARLRLAVQAWERHVALDPQPPDARTAKLMVSAYRELDEPAKAVGAQTIVATATKPPNSNDYAQLAQLAYGAGLTRAGDSAADKAVALAEPNTRTALRATLEQLKSDAAKQSG